MNPGTVRPAVKGVVIRGGRVLLLHHWYRSADYFELPGGGQDYGETLHQAVRREVLEETGVEVAAGRLLWARDYVAMHHEFADTEGHRHQVEIVLECRPTTTPPVAPAVPDTFQIGTVWAHHTEIEAMPIYPTAYKAHLGRVLTGSHRGVPYLGDVN